MQEKIQKISPVKQRILHFVDTLGISKRDFYAKTGISRGTLESKTGITEETITKLFAIYPNIDSAWLLTGQEDVQKQKIGLLNGDDILSQKAKYIAHETNNIANGIPLIGLDVAAGFGTAQFSISDQDIQALYVVPDFTNIDFMIRVKGSSMYPKYSSGDIIACRKLNDSKFIQWNKCYVIATTEQGLLIKRIRQCEKPDFLLAVSENKEYQPFEIPRDEITGVALVIGVIRLE